MKRPTISKPADIGRYKKVLCHGPSGAGKTRFASTWPKPLIFDWEAGTSSIDKDRNVAIVAKDQLTLSSFKEYIDWLATPDAAEYETVVIDSLTHLQNIFLGEKLGTAPDPRMVYGQFQQYLREIMEKLFSLNKNVVVICRSKMGEDIERQEKLFPELSPSAFAVIPALVDYAIVITGKTSGLGAKAVTQQLAFSKHNLYWTKTRTLILPEFAPTYEGMIEAIDAAKALDDAQNGVK